MPTRFSSLEKQQAACKFPASGQISELEEQVTFTNSEELLELRKEVRELEKWEVTPRPENYNKLLENN
jgi:hypothetical protein